MTTGRQTNGLAKGCGIALLIVALCLSLVAYAGWRLWHSLSSSNLTVLIDDLAQRKIDADLATKYFTVTRNKGSTKTITNNSSHYIAGSNSVESQYLSPVTAAAPKDPAAWTTPSAQQKQIIVQRLDEEDKDLAQQFSNMRVDVKDRLVSSLNVSTGVFCLAKLGGALPTN